jgi:hypothetical protein
MLNTQEFAIQEAVQILLFDVVTPIALCAAPPLQFCARTVQTEMPRTSKPEHAATAIEETRTARIRLLQQQMTGVLQVRKSLLEFNLAAFESGATERAGSRLMSRNV